MFRTGGAYFILPVEWAAFGHCYDPFFSFLSVVPMINHLMLLQLIPTPFRFRPPLRREARSYSFCRLAPRIPTATPAFPT